MRRLLAALITLAVIGAAAPAQAHSATTSPLRLPPPTGPYPVGVRSASVTDPARIDEQTHRPRRLPVRIWYPAARAGHGPSAKYLSPGAQDYAERALGLPAGWLDVDTHATADARPRGHLTGVVVVQHGGGTLAAFQTGQVIDLASRGYAVVTMEHPHESLVVEEANGTLIEGAPDADDVPFAERVLDASVVLAELPQLVPGTTAGTPVAMVGHSRGGAASAETMVHHPQVVAGVDVDGSLRGEVLTAGVDRPFGILHSLDVPVSYAVLTGAATLTLVVPTASQAAKPV